MLEVVIISVGVVFIVGFILVAFFILRSIGDLKSKYEMTSQVDETQKQLVMEVEQNKERYQTLVQTVQSSTQLTNTMLSSVQTLSQTINDMKQRQVQMDSNSNIKGNMGNILLKQMLEEVYGENTEGTLWKTEYSIDGVGRPDAVIFYKDVRIPIDSKNLKDDYIK